MEIEKRTRFLELWDKYRHFLTTKQQKIFQMYLIEDMSYGEIGEFLNTTRNNAYESVKSSMNKLEEIDKKMRG